MHAAFMPPIPESNVRYTLDGAAFLLRVPRTTVRTWANGYTKKLRDGRVVSKPGVLQTNRDESTFFTFPELIELLYVRELTRKKTGEDGKKIDPLATLDDVRDMVANLRDKLGSHPLAAADLRAVGRQIVTNQIEATGDFFTNAVLMQHLLIYADELAVDLEFKAGIASRWFPKPDHSIIVDPGFRFGQPIVSSGYTAETIYQRLLLEDGNEEDTAEWFDIPMDEVRAARRFEEDWLSKPAA